MATKKIPVLARFGSMEDKLKSEVENYFVDHPIESTFIDGLCRPFETSGSVVTCRPVVDHPLEVEWRRKNLIDKNELIYGNELLTSTGQTTPSSMWYTTPFIKIEPSTTYTASGFSSNAVCMYDVKQSFISFERNSTFTTGPNVQYVRLNSLTNGYDTPQLEIGTTATTYEPYAETATIIRCGKNLASTDILVGASGITETDGVFSGTVNSFYYATRNIGFVPAEAFEEGQQYVFSLYAKKGTAESTPYMVIRYTDGTQGATLNADANITAVDDFVRYAPVSVAGKTVQGVWLSYGVGGTDTLYIKDIQVEKGNIATAYEPYNGGTFAPGDPVPALAGINTLCVDTGTITVTGRADYTHKFDDILDRITALEAASVNNT